MLNTCSIFSLLTCMDPSHSLFFVRRTFACSVDVWHVPLMKGRVSNNKTHTCSSTFKHPTPSLISFKYYTQSNPLRFNYASVAHMRVEDDHRLHWCMVCPLIVPQHRSHNIDKSIHATSDNRETLKKKPILMQLI